MTKSVHVAVGEITPRTFAEVTSAFESPTTAFKKYVPREDPFVTPTNLMPKFDAAAASESPLLLTPNGNIPLDACEALLKLIEDESFDDVDEWLVRTGCFDRNTPTADKTPTRVVPTALSPLGTKGNPIIID